MVSLLATPSTISLMYHLVGRLKTVCDAQALEDASEVRKDGIRRETYRDVNSIIPLPLPLGPP